jgi:phosphoribosylformylglycinamidine (FGAM) synthase PurS component
MKIVFGVIFVMVAITITTWVLLPAGKAVERVVLEQSFQYSEGRKAEIATFQATLDEIDARLATTTIDPMSRQNLEAQRMTVSAQLNAAKRR